MTSTDTAPQSNRLETPQFFGGIRAIAARGLLRLRTPRPGRRLQLIERLPLGAKRQLLLIACDGQNFLVGAGGDGISAITPVGSPASLAPTDSGVAQTAPDGFTDWSTLQ